MLRRVARLGMRTARTFSRLKAFQHQSPNQIRISTVLRYFSDSQESDSDFKPKYKNLTENTVNVFSKIEFDSSETDETAIVERLRKEIKKSPVVVFIKGDFERPMCGYSNFIVQILKFYNVQKGAFVNVLENNDIRAHGK